MRTSYFTFGQNHSHRALNLDFDKDCVVKIIAEDPRAVMFSIFGGKWSMQYDEPPDMRLFPDGIRTIKVDLE